MHPVETTALPVHRTLNLTQAGASKAQRELSKLKAQQSKAAMDLKRLEAKQKRGEPQAKWVKAEQAPPHHHAPLAISSATGPRCACLQEEATEDGEQA